MEMTTQAQFCTDDIWGKKDCKLDDDIDGNNRNVA